MDREAEPRRDLAPAGGTYKMGGETFTITRKEYGVHPWTGQWSVVHTTTERGVPFGRETK
jgi:putative heme degradation protein